MGESLHDDIDQLTPRQRARVERLVTALLRGVTTTANPESDIADPEFLGAFGDLLVAHNEGSKIPLTKDKFEFAMVDALNEAGYEARKVPNGNPGEDIIVNEVPWSLKTQADRNIKIDRLHISKFMELGKGKWGSVDDLIALRGRMYAHMQAYERIFSLRCFPRTINDDNETVYRYELVEIPKSVLLMSRDYPIEVMLNSRQTPKPAYCRVTEESGAEIFSLYFDGGTERKLQVKNLRKDYCIVHATWCFSVS